MRRDTRRLGLCLPLSCLALLFWGAGASQASSFGGRSGMSPLSEALVVPGVESLDGGQEVAAVEEASLDAPRAVTERERSQTKFEHQSVRQAERTAFEAFPAIIDAPAGGMVPLGPGEKLAGFESADAARLDLSGGEHAMVVSANPIAVRGASGRWAPLNLHLHALAGSYAADEPSVAVALPKRLQEGARLPTLGVSLTPVDSIGTPLRGAEGVANGTSVFFANTQSDSDTVLKPTPRGLDASTILRSPASPQTLQFRIGLPHGARLAQPAKGGPITVLRGSTPLGVVLTPTAEDAAGTPVPVRMSASGSTIVLSVDHRATSYRYPIAVDPEFVGITEKPEGTATNNWHPYQAGGYESKAERDDLGFTHAGQWASGDYAFWQMQAKGYTKIYAVRAKTDLGDEANEGWRSFGYIPQLSDTSWAGAWLDLNVGGTNTIERSFREPPNSEKSTSAICANAECSPNGVPADNWTGMEITTTQSSAALEAELNHEGWSSSAKLEPTFWAYAEEALVWIGQEKQLHSSATFATATELEYESEGKKVKEPNVVANPNAWLSRTSGALAVYTEDGGLGVSEAGVEEYAGLEGWSDPIWYGLEDYLKTPSCSGIECTTAEHQTYTWSTLWGNQQYLPQGEDRIRPVARSAMEGSTGTGEERTIKVDSEPPKVTLSGLHTELKKYEVDGKQYEETVYALGEAGARIKVEATDGQGNTPSSGVQSIAVGVDGKEIGTTGGFCSPGPCSASHEFPINGVELGAGSYTLSVVATDNAGNVETTTYPLFVYHASPLPIGPGSVNPQSGDFAMEATDVAFSGGLGSLAVTRHYDSRNLTEGAEGPLGPQWTISAGPLAQLEVLPGGSVLVIGPEGLTHFNAKEGGGFEAPEGDTNLTLEYEPAKPAYIVKDPKQGSTTEFTLPHGAKDWLPTVSQGPVATDKTTDEYRTVELEAGKQIVQPTLELAAHPNTSCAHSQLEKLEIAAKGCRALEFLYYGESETAKGESEKEWGGYKDRLKEIVTIAYNPAKKEMVRAGVAAYLYDSLGHLRAEWNPSITPALKTLYGYDGEGHVTAVSPPGQQPWLLHYGTIPTETNPGRLLSVARLNAAAKLWNGKALENKKPPVLTVTTAVVGTALGIKKDTWSQKPVARNFQWERCNYAGADCAPIPGAVNETYTLVTADAGQEDRAKVTATDAAGSASATSELIGPVKDLPSKTGQFGSEGTGAGQIATLAAMALAPSGNVWVADGNNNRLDEFSNTNKFIEAVGWGVTNGEAKLEICTTATGCKRGHEEEYLEEETQDGEMEGPQGIAIDQGTGNIYVDDEPGWVEEFTASGAFVRRFGGKGLAPGQLEHPSKLAVDTSGNVWVDDPYECHVDEYSPTGALEGVYGECGTKLGQLTKESTGKLAFLDGSLYVSDVGKIEVLTEGKWQREFQLPPDNYNEAVTVKGLAADEVTGDLDVSVQGNPSDNIQVLTPTGALVEEVTYVTIRSNSELTVSPVTGDIYVSAGYGEVAVWTPGGPSQEPAQAPPSPEEAAVTTIDYEAPLSGTGVPQMTPSEVVKWGQKDDPVEATAIFPATEPMGWPATAYTRATMLYMDAQSRGVNLRTPSGGISTQEYNQYNEETRSLTAANRATALKEADPLAASELLDTKSYYTKQGELESTLGPQHTVRLAVGKEKADEETLARDRTRYFYDEGAKEAEEKLKEAYSLVTKTINAAETASHEEFDKRTTTTSYSGQSLLGWKLREPTSTTIEPSGLDLTTTTKYEEATGNVIEKQAPPTSGNPSVTGNAGARDTKTVYYTAKGEAEVETCRNHIEWAGLPCMTVPAQQPGTAGVPELPSTTNTYNMWDQVETATEAFGTAKRTRTSTFDAAGRPLTTEETESGNTSNPTLLPKITDKYNTVNGTIEQQSDVVGKETETVTSLYTTLNQPLSYTDSSGSEATFEYEPEGAERLTKVADPKGNQDYHYNETTGEIAELTDSGAGKFTVSRDVEGRVLSQAYPNGLTEYATFNSVGTETKLEDKKETHCTEKCVWFSDSIVPSIHGEPLKQVSTFSEEPIYAYDPDGRITEAQEIPTGEGCKTRLYAYEEDSNRTSLTTREPTKEGKCATEGGTTEAHTYDTGGRMTDPGIIYEQFGDITTLPAADAGGHELTSSYYVDGQVHTQTQAGKSIEYALDPDGRTRELISGGAAIGEHYDGPGGALAWTAEPAEAWTRNIPGIGGSLAATQKGHGTVAESAVILLHDLQGDIVGTVEDSENATGLQNKYNSTEFGVPASKEAPPKYAWLGASGFTSELVSGTVTQDGVTYVPQTGRPLQTQAVDVPSPSYEGTTYVSQLSAWVIEDGIASAAHQTAKAEEERAAAGIDPSCTLQSAIGGSISSTGKEWVYVRAWGSCSGHGLPRYSEAEACVVIQSDELEISGPLFDCGLTGVGFTPKYGSEEKYGSTEVYAHQHVRCEKEVSYDGWVWFWIPGMKEAKHYYTKGYTCGESPSDAQLNFDVMIYEVVPPVF
jgi:hypothetical protein